MFALLGAISARTWLEIGAVVVMAIAVAAGIQHIKDVQKAKDAAVAEAAVAKQVAHNAAVQATASETINAAQAQYQASVDALNAVPLPALPQLVCHSAASGGPVSGGAGTAGSGHGSAASAGILPGESTVEPGTVTVNAQGILTDAERADQLAAQVILLQNTIRAYQHEGVVAFAQPATAAPQASASASR